MNMVKVFNAKGEHVDSFRKPQGKTVAYITGHEPTQSQRIRFLNKNKLYVRSQLKSLKALA